MLYLSKFYHLLKKNNPVTLYDSETLDQLYQGPVKGSPAEFDSYTVEDFCTTDWGYQFYIKEAHP